MKRILFITDVNIASIDALRERFGTVAMFALPKDFAFTITALNAFIKQFKINVVVVKDIKLKNVINDNVELVMYDNGMIVSEREHIANQYALN